MQWPLLLLLPTLQAANNLYCESESIMSALNLLDKSIDEIDDLPGFEVPQNGMFSFRFSTATKSINGKEYVEANFEVLEAIELNDPSTAGESCNKPGTKFSMLFGLEGEHADKSISRLKELVAPISDSTGERNLLKLVTEVCKDMVVVGKVKRRVTKKDGEEKIYADVSDLQVG